MGAMATLAIYSFSLIWYINSTCNSYGFIKWSNEIDLVCTKKKITIEYIK